jgi:transcriptional regulator with XRE-family HTH domain
MDVDALIGWNFKRLRSNLGLSQEELALRLGTIDQAYISQLEAGERNPTGRTIFRLAEALGVSPGELFRLENVPAEISATKETGPKKNRAGRRGKK